MRPTLLLLLKLPGSCRRLERVLGRQPAHTQGHKGLDQGVVLLQSFCSFLFASKYLLNAQKSFK